MKTFFGRLKTHQRSPQRLQLGQFDWHLGAVAGLLCLGVALSPLVSSDDTQARVFLTLSGVALLTLGLMKTRKVSVSLDRSAGIVYIRTSTALRTQINSAPLHSLRQAQLHHSHTDEGGRGTLTLLFHDREEWTMNNLSAPSSSDAPLTDQINGWMHLHLPSCKQPHDTTPRLDSSAHKA